MVSAHAYPTFELSDAVLLLVKAAARERKLGPCPEIPYCPEIPSLTLPEQELELLSGEKLSALAGAEEQNFSLVHKKKNSETVVAGHSRQNWRMAAFCTLIYSLIHACWSASDV